MAAREDNLLFGRSRRMVSKADFERAFAARCTAGNSMLVVYVVVSGLDRPRLGMTIGKRHGNAVERNRLRRLLREAFRLEQHNLPGGFDYLLVPKTGARACLDVYREGLLRLARDAVGRWQARQAHSSQEK